MGGIKFLPYNEAATKRFFKAKEEERIREEQKAKSKGSKGAKAEEKKEWYFKRIISVWFSSLCVHTWSGPSFVFMGERVSLADHEVFVHNLIAVRLSRFPKPTELAHYTSNCLRKNFPLFMFISGRLGLEQVLVRLERR